jgi:MFS family permease
LLNSRKPSHELSIEETLTWTFDIYSTNFTAFFVPILISSLISGVLGAAITNYVSTTYSYNSTLLSYASINEIWGFVLAILAIMFVSVIISWIINTIAYGICVKYASDLINVGKANLEEAFDITLNRLISLLVAAFIVAILVVIGLIALIVPGIILGIMFALVVPAIINENIGAFDGMSRSRKLVSNRWLKTFVLFLIIVIIIAVVSYIGGLIAAPFGNFSSLVSSIITAFVGPIIPISMAVYYYSMLAKEEQQKPQPPPPPPF